MFRKNLFVVVVIGFLFSFGNCAMAGPLDGLSYDEKVVAITILAEAKGEGSVGMQAVACVIQQRSIEKKKTTAFVCLQRKQFSCWNGQAGIASLGNKVTRKNLPAVEIAIKLAKDLVSGKELDRSLVRWANHYHTLEVRPKWSAGAVPVAIIGHHKFFKL